jgi:hypothetical protein
MEKRQIEIFKLAIPRALGAGSFSVFGLLLAMCAVFVP